MYLKQRVYKIIEGHETANGEKQHFFDLFIITLIVLSVFAIILESYESLHVSYAAYFQTFEVITVIIFSIEYLLRIWTADLLYPTLGPIRSRLKFIFSFMGLVDLLAILPFFLPFFLKMDLRFIRIMRVVRLLRIFKLSRYTRALRLAIDVFYEKRNELLISLFVTFILLLMSSTIMYNLEHDIQADKFPDIVSTFWWAIATLTTVGYGDVYPLTGWGKLISGLIALLGIGLVALPTGILSAGFIEKIDQKEHTEKKQQEDNSLPVDAKKEWKFCPHCGERL